MDRPAGNRFATRSAVLAARGMVATSQPLATGIGLDVLKRGGSAVDAAIAANAALGLMEPVGCGIGGDLFAIVWDAGAHTLHGLNASGCAPRGLSLERLRRLGALPHRGPLSVSVPGAVDGWSALHARFGRLPLGDLLAPSIEYAHAGFPVTEIIAAAWAADAEDLRAAPGFAGVYLPNGRAPAAGETFVNAALADAYALIARDGRDAFYRGAIAAALHDTLAACGGFVTLDDLAAHSSEWVEPVATTYRGWQVFQLPPNGQGIAVLEMLNILEGFDLTALGFGSAEHLHVLLEAKKLAFEDRARFYADPRFARVPLTELISKSYAADRRRAIDLEHAALAPVAGDPTAFAAGDTVYLAAADAEGNMVSLIQSNYHGFGSGVTVERFGFGLQNRGSQFALEDGHANVFEPGKRPFHTIIPGFALRGGDALAFGVMGAAMQPQGQVQVFTNLVDFGMDVQAAGDAPRVRHDGSSEPTGGASLRDGGVVHLESGFAAAALDGLRTRGHRIARTRGGFGGYQAILRDSRRSVYVGASESRKDGHAAGY
jgi:gamma-glutamyltranspeptidase/glutathione hydrolase